MSMESLEFRKWSEEQTLRKWRRRRDIPLAILAWTAVIALAFWLAWHVIRSILLLVLAALLAYALAPAVKLLERIMPRFLSILIVYIVVFGAIGTLLYFVISSAVGEAASLSDYIRTLLTPTKSGQLSPLEQSLRSLGITSAQIASARDQLVARTENLAGSVVPLLTGFLDTLLDIVIVAVLSIYLLVDGSRATAWLRRNMPVSQQGRVHFLLDTLQRIVGGYIRGQLFLCALIGVLVGVGMQIIGVPYALLLGVLAFILEFIPVLGTLVSGAICVALALTKGVWIAVIVLAYFVVVHILEGDVVGPRIVGKAIGLHPVVSLAALIAGSELFGIWGALFASPIAGVLQALLIALWAEWRTAHPDQFQKTKHEVAQHVAENVADQPLNAS